MQDTIAYADDFVQTNIIPDYREFCRQLTAERAGRWAKYLDVLDKVFQIEAPVTSPKFYGDLAKALGFATLDAINERKAQLTNQRQAFQFMRTVEDYPS